MSTSSPKQLSLFAPDGESSKGGDSEQAAPMVTPAVPISPPSAEPRTDGFSLTAPRPAPRRGEVLPAEHPERLFRLRRQLPRGVRMGTSSWTFPGWADLVYDRHYAKSALVRRGLEAYGAHPLFRTVGVDRTYYAPVDVGVFADYAAAVPDDFRFLVKAHEYCTLPTFPLHDCYGERAGRPNPYFLDPHYAAEEVVGPFVEGLGDKAGPLLFQFSPVPMNRPGDRGEAIADRIHAFLDALPKGPRYAVEIRRRAWFTDTYLAALDDVGAVHCLNGHPSMPAIDEQAARVGSRGDEVVVRWMLKRGTRYGSARERFAPFNRIIDPDPDARAAIADVCIAAAERAVPATIIVNNKAEGSSPCSVEALAEELAIATAND